MTKRNKLLLAAAIAYTAGFGGIDNKFVDDYISGNKCGGEERWEIKVLSDKGAVKVKPKNTIFNGFTKVIFKIPANVERRIFSIYPLNSFGCSLLILS